MSVHSVSARALGRALVGVALASIVGGTALGSQAALAAHRSPGHAAAPRWLTWNGKTHTASLILIAAYNGALGGFNFNGYGNGKMVVTVPQGAHVKVTFTNKGAGVPHSVVITRYADRTSSGPFPVAFKGASSPNPTGGTASGKTLHIAFVANKAGTYAIVCAVPGHDPAGMWDVLKVVHGGKPSITFKH